MSRFLSMPRSTHTRWVLVSLALLGSACGPAPESEEPSAQGLSQRESRLDDEPCTLTGALPTMSLPSEVSMELECDEEWEAPEVTAADSCGNPLTVYKYNTGDDDGDGIPGSIDPDDFGPGPASTPGIYYVQYIAWDADYNIQTVIITVTVPECP